MCSIGWDWPGGTRTGPALWSQRPGWQLSDDDVETTLAALDRAEAALVARRAELVREADQRGLKDRSKALSTERWLQDRFRLSHRDAKARVDQARLLTGQPAAHQALAAGTITPEQAGVIATALAAVDQLDDVDPVEREQATDFLLDQATGLAPRDLATAAAHLVEQLTRTPSVDSAADAEAVARELAAAEAAAQRAETNTFVVKHRPDGTIAYRGTIRPVDAPALTAWLKRADVRHPGCDGFEDDRPREQRRGDHLVQTLRTSLTHSGDSSGSDGGDGSGVNGGGAGAGSGPSAGRVQVHVNVSTTLDALRDAWGSPLPVDTGHAAWAAVCRAAVSNWTGVNMPIAECRRRRL
jgi:hypothetical protein